MENRLKNLRKSMENTTFKQLHFSDKISEKVKSEIQAPIQNDEEIILAILQLLQRERTGYELTGLLRSRGVKRFEHQEGFLYTVLHRLEHNRLIRSQWNEEGAKQYQIHDKGRKLVRLAEQDSSAKRVSLKELLGE
jgi:DNA-binding PadR family transcriptional regulator